MKFAPVLVIFVGLVSTCISTKLEPELLASLNAWKNIDISINFDCGDTELIQTAQKQKFHSRGQNIEYVVSSLQSRTIKCQQSVVGYLESKSVSFQSFWISNQIYVNNASLQLVLEILKHKNVHSVTEVPTAKLSPNLEAHNATNVKAKGEFYQEWNLDKIEAPRAWNITNGTGVVIANVNTGIRYTHNLLKNGYRHDYGWYDPYFNTSTPYDGLAGLGTHTMGIMTGSDEIGVAPGAKWIACKACTETADYQLTCLLTAVLSCFQWAVCPTLPDGSGQNCSMAPHVLFAESEEFLGENLFFEKVAKVWHAAGIIPVFPVGDKGGRCSSVVGMAKYMDVLSVGATLSNDGIWHRSSNGPTSNGDIKPDVSAPGYWITSAAADSDSAYGINSGSSSAAAHVAGTVALLLSIKPGLNFREVRQIILNGVDTNLTSEGKSCGGVQDVIFPNNQFGYGRINAWKVVQPNSGSSTFNAFYSMFSVVVAYGIFVYEKYFWC